MRLSQSPHGARHRANGKPARAIRVPAPPCLSRLRGNTSLPPRVPVDKARLAPPAVSHTHQMIELPPIDMQITPFLFHPARWVGGGRMIPADVPSAYATGDGPRLSGLLGARAGMPGTSRRLLQDCCQSGLPLPLSLGAIPKVIARASRAILPHYESIAELARNAIVG
jgi:hypothetical protein